MKKILFTGAHYNSALVVLDELVNIAESNSTKISFIWVGRKFISDGKLSPEYSEVTKRENTHFINFIAGKIYRTTSIRYLLPMIFNFALIPFGFLMAFFILLFNRPNIIISFGGYVAVPIVVVGKILGIPSVTHEQTAAIGLANKVIERFVDQVYTSWPLRYYENVHAKMIHTGLPLNKSFFDVEKSGKYKFNRNLPILYITGGKSGSRFINDVILDSIEELLKDFNLIWSCGSNPVSSNYKNIKSEISKLSSEFRDSIILKEYFFADEIGKVLNSCNLVLTRGGAHTIYELIVLQKPAIIVPIPWASNNEQAKNAQVLVDIGLGVSLDQEALDKDKLINELREFKSKLKRMKLNEDMKQLVRIDSGQFIANDVFKKLSKSKQNHS